MVTTSRLVPLDAVLSDGTDRIHLTGWLPVVARTAMRGPPPGAPVCSPVPVQVDLRFEATRVRGVGLKTGARYWVEGVHQSRHHPGAFSPPFGVVSRFELRGCAPDGSQPTQRTLTVRFRVTVPTDGSVTITIGEVELR
jgi:hypothetical protein